ncbi:MAG: DUF4112 domain-containing protein [Patescibacteria group bacterium]|jgi:hypothetical protein
MEDKQRYLKQAEFVAQLLDSQFSILGFKFGLDPILGLVPWFGDVVSVAFSLYLVSIGKKMGMPDRLVQAMVRNVLVDLIVGSVPLVGDIGDFFIKANQRNLKIIRKFASLRKETIVEGEITG